MQKAMFRSMQRRSCNGSHNTMVIRAGQITESHIAHTEQLHGQTERE